MILPASAATSVTMCLSRLVPFPCARSAQFSQKYTTGGETGSFVVKCDVQSRHSLHAESAHIKHRSMEEVHVHV